MEIVHVCRVAPPSVGGMEQMLAGLTLQQSRMGEHVRVVTLKPWGSALMVPTYALSWRGSARWPIVSNLQGALAGADIIHMHGIDAITDQVLTLRPKGAKVGVSSHGGFFHTRKHLLAKELWLRTLTRASLARADAVWFTSQSDRERLKAGLPKGDVVEIGVDLTRMRRIRSARAPERGRWLVLGRLDVHKGVEHAIEALVGARDAGSDVFLDIVGPVVRKDYAQSLQTQAERAGVGDRVIWHCEVTDAKRDTLIARAEVALFPSQFEGFGIALVELMGAGLPVVANAIPAHLERATEGQEASFADFANPSSVLQAIERRLDAGARESMTRAAIARAEASSWEKRALVWRAAYQSLLDAGR